MSGCLIIFKSITYAQKAEKIIQNSRIGAYIMKPPLEISGSSCRYAVRVGENCLSAALAALSRNGLTPAKVCTCLANGRYKEETF